MERANLVRYLSETAADLVDQTKVGDAGVTERLEEASELLALAARIAARAAVNEQEFLQDRREAA